MSLSGAAKRAVLRAMLVVGLGTALGAGLAQAQTAVTITPPNLSGAVAGSLNGSASVSPSGASRYSVGIAIPPGTAGLVPSVSLEYSSQAGMDLLGLGWTIGGQSEITRCPTTIAQDGVRGVVKLTAADQFCLDGQRLLLVSGTHGATAEYRTQVETFSQITSSGSNPATGPNNWTVRTKSGLIYTYGNTSDSDATLAAQSNTTVALKWAVSRVSDRRGNYYSYHYYNDPFGGEFYLKQIRYTGNTASATLPYNAVNFVYESGQRPDPWTGYVAGSALVRNKRLSNVQTVINIATDGSGTGGTLVRDYRIAYTVNPQTGRSFVDTISDCNAAGNCLPATQFSWTPAWSSTAYNYSATGGGNWGGPIPVIDYSINGLSQKGQPGTQVQNQTIVADVDGDGKTDLVRGDGAGSWRVCLSTGAGFNCADRAGPAGTASSVLVGDFMGLGRMQIAIRPYVNGVGTWQICSFSATSDLSCVNWTAQSVQRSINSFLVADVNGDGLDDIIIGAGTTQLLCRSTGTGFATDASGNCVPYYVDGYLDPDSEPGSTIIHRFFQTSGDFWGDGRVGVMQPYSFGYMRRAADTGLEPGMPFDQPLVTGTPAGGFSIGMSLAGDFNGDGYVEFFSAVEQSSNVFATQICRSTGIAFKCELIANTTQSNYQASHVADVDGDGRPEIYLGAGICQVPDRPPYQLGVNVLCQQIDLTGTYPTGQVAVAYGDFNGDGIIDKAVYAENGGTKAWWIYLATDGGITGKLQQVTDGAGKQVQFSYSRLNDTAVYTQGAVAAFPKHNLTTGDAVVKTMTVVNPQGGTLATDYKYQGLRTDVQGRGALGFDQVSATDRVTNITTTSTYSQDFPYIGMPKTVLAKQQSQGPSCALSNTVNSFATLSTSGGAKYPYISSSTVTTQDLNCAPISTATSTIDLLDSYGNVTNSTDTVTADADVVTTSTTNVYGGPGATISVWPYNLLASTSVTKPSAVSGANGDLPNSVAKISPDNFSYNTPANTGSGHFIGIRNSGYHPVTVSGLSYTSTSGAFNAWMAASGSGNPNGGYCWPGVVLQPGWSCGAWANAGSDSGAGTATFATSAGNLTYSGNFTAKLLAYNPATGAVRHPTTGQTDTLYTLTINNPTPYIFYFPQLGATGQASKVGRFVGGNAGTFLVTSTSCGASLAAGANCTVSIAATGVGNPNTLYTTSFQPNGTFQQTGDGVPATWAGAGNWLVNMGTSITDVFASAMAPVNLQTDAGPTFIARWSTTSLNFGNVTAGTPSSQNITLYNDGNTAYNWAANNGLVNVPAQYTVNTSACTNVAPGGSCNVVVTFTPPLAGSTYSGSGITLTSVSSSANSFSVTGVGYGSVATLAPGTQNLNFGTVAQNAPQVHQYWTFTNTGNAPLNLTMSPLNNPFAYYVNVNSCSNIAPGSNCVIHLIMGTLTVGSFSQSGISGTGATQGNPSGLSVTGTVYQPVGAFTYVSLSSTGTGPFISTWTFRNDNTSAVNITAISEVGQGNQSTPVLSSSSTCKVGNALGAGATCTVVYSAAKDCLNGYTYHPVISNSAGAANGAVYSVGGTGRQCL